MAVRIIFREKRYIGSHDAVSGVIRSLPHQGAKSASVGPSFAGHQISITRKKHEVYIRPPAYGASARCRRAEVRGPIFISYPWQLTCKFLIAKTELLFVTVKGTSTGDPKEGAPGPKLGSVGHGGPHTAYTKPIRPTRLTTRLDNHLTARHRTRCNRAGGFAGVIGCFSLGLALRSTESASDLTAR